MNIDVKALNEIDLTNLGELITGYNNHKNYFLEIPGKEHYKLLAYMSTLFNDTVLLDVGTNRGLSGLALSYNDKNKVISFDLEDVKQLTGWPSNVSYLLGWVTMPEYKPTVMESSFIFLDTMHDGIFEHQFYHYLRSIGWKGILMLDDIKLNQRMKEFWECIEEEKYDISKHGHWSGTGAVFFS